ncbi:DUF2252 domain-containing protein [Ralstonia sp. ASV6]|uniref:DUF2252 domain-containing protein n=1 Tax=Ralstonia sp. ASV6 TaxID=2795124 RepID=UPI0018ECE602|nr:DUF2252 family protein [Ralstonia sp. ASV6]
MPISTLPRGAVRPRDRQDVLRDTRNRKMARSAHAYVRGNTVRFYEWLDSLAVHTLPEGPAIWICGDCHVGNLGPIGNAEGDIEVQIRDMDQTVIGNPAHDLIRLGLSLATAARGSDLPGVTTARMIQALMEGYIHALGASTASRRKRLDKPDTVHVVMRQAVKRSWKHLARERIENTRPTIPLGKRFWPLRADERRALARLFEDEAMRHLVTHLRSRDDDAQVELLDCAYWVKGCSSLGRLRYAALLGLHGGNGDGDLYCMIDVKEAVQAAAPRYPRVRMPRDNGQRVVEGARHLAPFLGERMVATRFLDHGVFVRELLPQDLKLEIDTLKQSEAMRVAYFLAETVGKAHARQMDTDTARAWQQELKRQRSKTLAAPFWLWTSIVELMSSHERGYLEHCRQYALGALE